MGASIELRSDFDGPRLRELAKRSRDGAQARRLLALAEIYDGRRRSDAARLAGVGLQIIRDWVVRFNAEGPDGLGRGFSRRYNPKSGLQLGTWQVGGLRRPLARQEIAQQSAERSIPRAA